MPERRSGLLAVQYRNSVIVSEKVMNLFTRWCYRIGLVCGALALLSALVVIPFELGVSLPEALRKTAEQTFLIFGLAFMWLGIVLLIAAIALLRSSWSRLSKSVKVVSVLGLGASTFLGAYVFYWLFPNVLNDRHT